MPRQSVEQIRAYHRHYNKHRRNLDDARKNTARWKSRNPELVKDYSKKYYLKNGDKIRAYADKKRKSDGFKEKNRTYQREWQRKRVQKVESIILNRLRARIRTAVQSNGGKKFATTERLIGCDVEFLKWYIESRFTEGMNWKKLSNGEIHIDHHIPCAEFDLTDETQQKQCFHYSNLRPLWSIDNLHKAARRPPTHQGELI